MDAVSRILRMARLEAQLDKRCLLGASTRMDVEYGPQVAPFHVLLEGECDLLVGATTVHLTAGDVVILPNNSVHRITTGGVDITRGTVETAGPSFFTTRSDSDEPVEPVIDLFCGHFTIDPGAGAMLFQSLPEVLFASFEEDSGADETIRMLSTLLRSEAEREGAGTAAIMSALCAVLFALVLRTSASDTDRVLWTAAGDERIGRLIEQVVANPGEDWSIERMGEYCRMSRSTLVRRFTESTGTTIGAFLTRTRLMEASELLRSSDRNVADIAESVGYRSESAFTRAFREATGSTPARFRRAQTARA